MGRLRFAKPASPSQAVVSFLIAAKGRLIVIILLSAHAAISDVAADRLRLCRRPDNLSATEVHLGLISKLAEKAFLIHWSRSRVSTARDDLNATQLWVIERATPAAGYIGAVAVETDNPLFAYCRWELE